MGEKHGGCGTRLHRIWAGMKARCYTPSATGYEWYGGKGITVCDEWRYSFAAFREWALATGYREDLTIDRKNSKGPYAPDNCRWATMKEQLNNTQHNRRIRLNGEIHTLTEWSRIVGITDASLSGRLSRGWTVEEALTTPKGGRRHGGH